MNRTIALSIAVAASTLAGAAFAESPLAGGSDAAFQSSKTRAEVLAELQDFKRGPNVWSTSYNPLRTFKSTASRADVTAGYVNARDQVAALHGEDSGSAFIAQNGNGARFLANSNGLNLAGTPANAQ